MAGTHLLERKPAKLEEVRVEPASLSRRPDYQAYQVLRVGFTIAPILAGIDKFLHVLANWDMYLANSIENLLPVSGHTFMLIVGAVEIVAGLLVAFAPRIGAWVVAAWLCGIIVDLLLIPGFYDVALRDLGLAIGAVALGLLARKYDPSFGRGKARVE